MKIVEINCATGEETVRDMTAQELSDAQARIEKLEAEQAEAEAKAAARQAILDRLGLNEEEVRLLFG